MKSAETKSSPVVVQRKAVTPFFKRGGESFLGNDFVEQTSFFSGVQTPVAAIRSSTIQAKLSIGQPNDKYEKEADAMADQVVQRMSNSESVTEGKKGLQLKRIGPSDRVSVQTKCAECEKEEKLQTKLNDSENRPIKIQRKPIFESESESMIQRKQESRTNKVENSKPSTINPLPVVPLFSSVRSSPATIQAKCGACEHEEKLQLSEEELPGGKSEKVFRKPIFESDERFTDLGASILRKCSSCGSKEELISRKAIVQTRLLDYSQIVQRSCRECDEGDKVLMKPIETIQCSSFDRSAEADGSRTSVVAAAQGELGKVEARMNDGTGSRVGAERLLEYFHIAAPGVWDDSIIETAGAEMPSWCGIFSVWAHKKAGKDVGEWQMGKGVSAFNTLTQTDNPQPGDIGYIHEPNQHHALVKEVQGEEILTIDGNSGINSEVKENTKAKSEYTGFLTAFGGSVDNQSTVQAKSESKEASTDSSSIESRLSSTVGKGYTLPVETRSGFEQSFGADFSNVRIHTDTTAQQLSKDLNAQAFTHGSDIYFNAGKYDTSSNTGKHLLAHELTHTLQQGAATQKTHVQKYSWDEFTSDVSDATDAVYDTASDAAETVLETATDVGEAVYDAGSTAVDTISDVASAAYDWLATEAGQLAQSLVDRLGGTVSFTDAGLEIHIPGGCPIDALTSEFSLEAYEAEWLVPVFELPIPPNMFINGEIGITGSIAPMIETQLGPFCFDDLHIIINPFNGSSSIAGGMSITTAVSLGAMMSGGLKGELSLTVIVPLGPVPVPITFPLVAAEGGPAVLLRGIGAQTFHLGGVLSYSDGQIMASPDLQYDMGLAGDLFAGFYAQLEVMGMNICQIFWQPYEWHDQIAYSLGISGDIGYDVGNNATGISVDPPTIENIPFEEIPLAISRDGFKDDCPVIDQICQVLEYLNLLPSQNGGTWDWSGTGHDGVYGPGQRLEGPLDVYETDPGLASESTCRGACGPNCDTCEPPVETFSYTDPGNGDVWEYYSYRECDSNDGCREHDAAFDWAATEQGETGDWAIIMPWHMAANIECACNNLAGNCAAWIFGLPPYDMKMFFAESSKKISSEEPGGGGGTVLPFDHPIGEEGPDFYHYSASQPSGNFTAGVERWTNYLTNCQAEAETATGVGGHRFVTTLPNAVVDTYIDRSRFTTRPRMSVIHGVIYPYSHFTNHTEIPAHEYTTTTLTIFSPDCQVQNGSILPSGNEEEDLDRCDRNELPPDYCEELQNRVIERFGNRDRDLDFDPDTDVDDTRRRVGDPPSSVRFRLMYNRLDSWDIFIRNRQQQWYPEFDSRFHVNQNRSVWMEELKQRTKEFKLSFRDTRTQDTDRLVREFEQRVLDEMSERINVLNHEIAAWYKTKTGSDESLDEIIERIHEEGTEIWREQWRSAILAVNRILSRLWPPSKSLLQNWVAVQRGNHPDTDLTGPIGDVDYIGSLATGYKGVPKQYIRFNPEKFDVDANIEAPPLHKFAMNIMGITPDRGRIFAIGNNTTITPLIDFCNNAHRELSTVHGYNNEDPFDVVIKSPNTPGQERTNTATDRVYALRESLSSERYNQMINDLRSAGLLSDAEGPWQVKDPLSRMEMQRFNHILRRYE